MVSDNDMRWFAARLAIAIEDVRRSGGMSVNEMKQALRAIPGAEGLTLSYASNGDQVVTIAGRSVAVSPTATNAEIAAAFAAPTPDAAPATVTVLPAVTYNSTAAPVVATPTQSKSMSISGAVPATQSVKDLIASSRTLVQSAHAKLAANAAKVSAAASALDTLGDTLGKEGDDLLAMIGQFTNGAPAE